MDFWTAIGRIRHGFELELQGVLSPKDTDAVVLSTIRRIRAEALEDAAKLFDVAPSPNSRAIATEIRAMKVKE